MRFVLLLSLLASPVVIHGQARPAQPRAGRAVTPARTAMVLTVTDPAGATLRGIRVEVIGASDRSGDTDENGTLRFANMRAGTYRLRFTGDGVIPFEREVIVRAGQATDVDVMLHPAPDREAEATEAGSERAAEDAAAAAPPGPVGEPKTLSILTLLDKELIRREPRKETVLGCSGNARTTLLQVNEPLPERLYETAESMYYVVAGEGTMRINGRETPLAPGTFALVPRGASHAVVRRGRNPVILLAVLSGEPCETNP